MYVPQLDVRDGARSEYGGASIVYRIDSGSAATPETKGRRSDCVSLHLERGEKSLIHPETVGRDTGPTIPRSVVYTPSTNCTDCLRGMSLHHLTPPLKKKNWRKAIQQKITLLLPTNSIFRYFKRLRSGLINFNAHYIPFYLTI